MQFKRMSIFVVAISLFWLAGRGASALLVAKAIAPPRAPFSHLLRLALRPPYRMATPHRNLLANFRLTLIPSVEACSPPTCTGEEKKAISDPNCPQDGNAYYCPDCTLTQGCTWYACKYTGTHSYCSYAYGTPPARLVKTTQVRTTAPIPCPRPKHVTIFYGGKILCASWNLPARPS